MVIFHSYVSLPEGIYNWCFTMTGGFQKVMGNPLESPICRWIRFISMGKSICKWMKNWGYPHDLGNPHFWTQKNMGSWNKERSSSACHRPVYQGFTNIMPLKNPQQTMVLSCFVNPNTKSIEFYPCASKVSNKPLQLCLVFATRMALFNQQKPWGSCHLLPLVLQDPSWSLVFRVGWTIGRW